MLSVLVARWYLLLARGLASIAFGVFALVLSHLTVGALTILLGLYALLDGSLALALTVRMRGRAGFGSLMCETLVSVVTGIVAMALSALPPTALLSIASTWVIFRGIALIALSIELREEVSGAWPLPLAAAVSILCGFVLMLGFETAGALAMVWILAVYGVAVGIALMVLALRFQRFAAEIPVG